MTNTHLLSLPNFQNKSSLEADTSNTSIGAVLLQEGHPIAYHIKALNSRNQTLPAYEKECLAILLAIEKWYPNLQHRSFDIHTNHKSLLHLTDQRLHTSLQHKDFVKLMDLQFTLKYRRGVLMQWLMGCQDRLMILQLSMSLWQNRLG
jgi:hypothetical protein